MTTKAYIALGIALAALLAIWSGISQYRLSRAELRTEQFRQAATRAERLAAEKELQAAAYEEKIEYLEAGIEKLRTQAKENDERIRDRENDVRNARRRVDAVRRQGTKPANTADVCEKLTALGYTCEGR
ncbi:MAG: hypothetical protein HS105_12430 [Chloracidobacterium sp.]|nr:hypothetical protein [Chloracidobacterium sp.]MCO5332878.1 hypothetical protein [Pyrinomonadaceae bacterium]